MFHIKPDKRCEESANLLYEALIKLLKIKKLESISVQSVCKLANVSRATFYRNFDILEDILIWKCDYESKQIISQYNNENDFIEYALSYCINKYELLEALLSANRLEILFDAIFEHSKALTYIALPEIDTSDSFYKYFITIHFGVFTSILRCWLINGRKETLDELLNYFKLTIEIAKNDNFFMINSK